MDTWYRITFSNDQVAHGAMTAVQNVFVARYLDLNLPKDVALFENSHPDVFEPLMTHEYYFTPAAATLFQDLVRQYGGKACPEPDPVYSTFQVGDESYLGWQGSKRIAGEESETD